MTLDTVHTVVESEQYCACRPQKNGDTLDIQSGVKQTAVILGCSLYGYPYNGRGSPHQAMGVSSDKINANSATIKGL